MIIVISKSKVSSKNLFSNGYKQNVIFFCKLIKKHFTESTILYLQSHDDFNSIMNEYNKIDLLIEITPLDKNLSTIYKKKYPMCKKVFVKYGHEYYNDLSRLLPKGQNNVCCAPKAYNIDEVWISPHFESTKYYYQALYNAKVKILPFIWEPDNLKMNQFTLDDFYRKKDIYIIEPHINNHKTSLIPILIVNELWKQNPDCFNKLYIVGNNPYSNNEYFKNHLLSKIEVLHSYNDKAFFCPRARFPDIFINPGVLLCHQENCGLNYIYLEALFIRIPLVHNSSYIKESGYYYTDKNILEGVSALKKALAEFKPIDNSLTIDRYSYDNHNVVKNYKKLFDDSTYKIKKYNEIRKKDWCSTKTHLFFKATKYFGRDREGGFESLVWRGNIPGDIPIKINKYAGADAAAAPVAALEGDDGGNVSDHDGDADDEGDDDSDRATDDEDGEDEKRLISKTITSFVISVDEIRKKEMASKLKDNYYFIDAEKFAPNISKEEKMKILTNNHIKCWKQALKMELDEVFIFEDDVIFIDNWRKILNCFIIKQNPNIIRLDSIPYRIFPKKSNNSILFYKAISPWCAGGYYMSKKAIIHCIDFFSNNNHCHIVPIEKGFIKAFQKFEDTIYTSSPRICIQDWYKNSKSSIQNTKHMEILSRNQKIYLKRYGDYYPEYINNK